jgi:hypothetical protein
MRIYLILILMVSCGSGRNALYSRGGLQEFGPSIVSINSNLKCVFPKPADTTFWKSMKKYIQDTQQLFFDKALFKSEIKNYTLYMSPSEPVLVSQNRITQSLRLIHYVERKTCSIDSLVQSIIPHVYHRIHELNSIRLSFDDYLKKRNTYFIEGYCAEIDELEWVGVEVMYVHSKILINGKLCYIGLDSAGQETRQYGLLLLEYEPSSGKLNWILARQEDLRYNHKQEYYELKLPIGSGHNLYYSEKDNEYLYFVHHNSEFDNPEGKLLAGKSMFANVQMNWEEHDIKVLGLTQIIITEEMNQFSTINSNYLSGYSLSQYKKDYLFASQRDPFIYRYKRKKTYCKIPLPFRVYDPDTIKDYDFAYSVIPMNNYFRFTFLDMTIVNSRLFVYMKEDNQKILAVYSLKNNKYMKKEIIPNEYQYLRFFKNKAILKELNPKCSDCKQSYAIITLK